MSCPYAKPVSATSVQCALLPPQIRVSTRICATCMSQWTDGQPPNADNLTPALVPLAPSRGLGDTVAKLTSAVGVFPCGGCKRRQRLLNDLIPYRRR